MRKIYQSAPDVPQAIANRAVDIIERHFAQHGVRRAEELPEESKVRLLRELQKFFQTELPAMRERGGELAYDVGSDRAGNIGRRIARWLQQVFRWGGADEDQ